MENIAYMGKYIKLAMAVLLKWFLVKISWLYMIKVFFQMQS